MWISSFDYNYLLPTTGRNNIQKSPFPLVKDEFAITQTEFDRIQSILKKSTRFL